MLTNNHIATEYIFTADTYGGQREMITCIPCSVSVMATQFRDYAALSITRQCLLRNMVQQKCFV